jgi:hypothetical protein
VKDLTRLPTWQRYAIGLAVAAPIVFLAWKVGSARAEPGWLPPLKSIWIVLGPLLLAFFVIRALIRRIRGRHSDTER